MITPGQKYLINTDQWFFAPDGENYKAVFGTVHSVVDAEQTLGLKTNRNSTSWYVVVGDMIVAGCQIHYAVRAESFNPNPSEKAELDHDGKRLMVRNGTTRIYDADASRLIARTPNSTSAGWTPPAEADRPEGFECLAMIPVRWERGFVNPKAFEWLPTAPAGLTIEGMAMGWAPMPAQTKPGAAE